MNISLALVAPVPAGPAPTRPVPAGVLGGDDLMVIRWIGRHGMVSLDQVARMRGAGAEASARRLRRLRDHRLLHLDRVWHGMSPIVRITGRGLALAGCDLMPAALDLARLRHSLAVCDLGEELSAEGEWVTERELRRDRMRTRGRTSAIPRRTPDGLLLIGRRRVAVELDLTPKRTGKLQMLASAYALDREIDHVLWYLPSDTAAARMEAVVGERGLGHLMTVRCRRVAPLPW